MSNWRDREVSAKETKADNTEVRNAATHYCNIICTYKDGVYSPISLDSRYALKDELRESLDQLGFEVRKVPAIIIVKLRVEKEN